MTDRTAPADKNGVQTITPIGFIRTELPEKFGVPRQSGVVKSLLGLITFAPAYRNADALRELGGFSHVWLIWQFSANADSDPAKWQPTVRPPRLGGNRRVGVFASRSPFRPNHLGLSVVKLEGIITCPEEESPWDGPAGPGEYPYLRISGMDMIDGTPLYDIKPYMPYSDIQPDALPGYTAESWKKDRTKQLTVVIPEKLRNRIPDGREEALRGLLLADPRPPYQNDPDRIYGMQFAGVNIKFYVKDDTVTVTDIEQL